MELTPTLIDIYKELLINPNKYGDINYIPLSDCFKECEEVTPKHILYESYIKYLGRPLSKVIFYIIMDELYDHLICKDDNKGDLGYKLKLIV